MFSLQHIIWLVISFLLIFISLFLIVRRDPGEKTVFSIACLVCIFSEAAKVFSTVRMIPLNGGTTYVPFIEMQELPLHLCSIHIFFIFYIRFFAKEGPSKLKILAFMFSTMTIGAVLALFLPTVFAVIPPEKAFIHPQIYQTFIYHSMLVVLGIYIYRRWFAQWTIGHYFSTMRMLVLLAFASIYVNSMLLYPEFNENNEIAAARKITNFFFVVKVPVGINLTEKWQWFIYLAVMIMIAVVMVGAWYIPVFLRERSGRRGDPTSA